MKISIEIPEGKYCGGCLLLTSDWPDDGFCNLRDDWVQYEQFKGGHYPNRIIKHPECPSLKSLPPKQTVGKQWVVA